MQLFGFCTGLLLSAACFVASVASTERVISCDDNNNVHRMSCDNGVISVVSALYGRADRDMCNLGIPEDQRDNTECAQEGTVDILKKKCNGKTVCEIKTSLVRTSDPCSGIFKYLDTNYTCLPAHHVIVCEYSSSNLYCDEGQVIFVYGANYGRSDRFTCSYKRPISQTNGTCGYPASRVAQMCNGKNSCIVTATNLEFGDPCKGIFKYLEVAYVCEYPGLIPEEFEAKV